MAVEEETSNKHTSISRLITRSNKPLTEQQIIKMIDTEIKNMSLPSATDFRV